MSATNQTAMPKYKIAYFNFVTHYGGLQQANAEVCIRLSKKHDVFVYDPFGSCDEHRQRYQDTSVKYTALHPEAKTQVIGHKGRPIRRLIRLASSMPAMLKVAFRLRQRLLEDRPDVIFIASTKAARVLSLAAYGMHIPVLYYLHWFEMADYLVKSRVCERVDGILALTDSIRQVVIDQGIPAERVFTCHNSFEPDVLLEKSGKPLDASLPMQESPVRVLLTGSLIPRKGQNYAISAIKKCVDAGLDTVLYLAGDSPHGETDEYCSGLRVLASSLGIEDRIHFLGWRSDIPQLIKHSTMLVLPSLAEGLPLSLMESMTLGCPVASTPVGGVPDLIQHEKTGWLFDLEDEEGLSKCILAAHSDKEKTQAVVENARQHVSTSFSVPHQMELFETAVSTLLDKN